jgi:hypothetical protein
MASQQYTLPEVRTATMCVCSVNTCQTAAQQNDQAEQSRACKYVAALNKHVLVSAAANGRAA